MALPAFECGGVDVFVFMVDNREPCHLGKLFTVIGRPSSAGNVDLLSSDVERPLVAGLADMKFCMEF